MILGLTIDPGMMNGICLWATGPELPFRIDMLWQFPGGAEGLRQWMEKERFRTDGTEMYLGVARINVLVVEKFTPRPNERFNLTLESVEPLRGEGVLIGAGFGNLIEWREPSQQYFVGGPGAPLEEKRKRARSWLAEFDMLPTGSSVGQKDANDAISAILHSLAYLRKKKHIPTLMRYFPPRPE